MIAVLCGLGLVVSAAPAQTVGGTTGAGPAPIETDTASTGERQWVFFPINPPPLGAEVAAVAAGGTGGTPTGLRPFLTDPFFTPLATRVVHVEGEPRYKRALGTEEDVQLDSFLQIRAVLVDELHERAEHFMRLALDQRLAAFEDFASTQEVRLAAMESTAEWLRERLARRDPWNEYRSWRLLRGPLRLPRDKTYVLEFQVVRAAAYYLDGLSPAQRRLVRELTIEMNEAIATQGKSDAGGILMYFSPDTTRILRPQTAPADLHALVERYLGEKRRLKDELRDVIYETDGAVIALLRTRRIEELAEAQSAAIDNLEAMAERIRRGIALLPDYRRLRGRARLSAGLEERLHAYAERMQKLEVDRAAFIEHHVAKARDGAGSDLSVRSTQDAADRARARFEVEHGDRLIEHERAAEALLGELMKELPSEEAVRLNGPADLALRGYLARREELDAYADYDLAALEPGLSPAQRRLLLASAMSRLRLAMLPPELQPTYPPGTLLGVGR